jgi:hypothetical protein
MPLPDRAALTRRIERVSQRLAGALAFSGLLTDLDQGEGSVAEGLVAEAQAAIEGLEEGRKALQVVAGQTALRQVGDAEAGCERLFEQLIPRDLELSPSAIRQCLRQRHGLKAEELIDLLKFYLNLEVGPTWSPDRIDKVDLLITQLGNRLGGPRGETDPELLTQTLAALNPAASTGIAAVERTTFRTNLATIKKEVEATDSLRELIDSGILDQYRRLKHRLGHLLLHPDLLDAVVETNLGLQGKIRRLNSHAVTKTFSTYQAIFELGLKGKIDSQLKTELDQLHHDFDRLERDVNQEEIRLTELEEFWRTLKTLSARLEQVASETEPEDAVATQAAATAQARTAVGAEPTDEWLKEEMQALLDLLREIDRKGWPAELVSLSPQEEFEIDPSEIEAFRRLEGEGADPAASDLFLLQAAALRRSIKMSAKKLADGADDETWGELSVQESAQRAVQLADSYLARYSQAVERAILEGNVSEARNLQILRMRLVREFSGAWLQVHRPERAAD